MLQGRDAELETVRELVEKARAGTAGSLLVRGDAGSGKSALLDAAVAQAGQDPETEILRCSGTEFEGRLSYSGLHQILLPVLHLVDTLPVAQATALRRGLGENDGPVNHFAVCVATFALLASASENRPLLLVVDDLQWLDTASTSALLFTARRLQADPVAVLFALREPSETTLRGVPDLVLGGLAPAAARAMLAARGWRASAVVTDALVAATGGNPLALSELARTGASGPLARELLLGGTVPLGRRLREMFGRRAAELPSDGDRLALVLAAHSGGELGPVLDAAGALGLDPGALAAVEDAGLVTVSGTAVRFVQPLVRSAVYGQATFHDRAAVHEALAAVMAGRGDPVQAVLHRAAAATGPDGELAADLERFAYRATGRGDQAATAHMMGQAARLTGDRPQRLRRLTAAAYAAWRSGQADLAQETIERIRRESPDSGSAVDAEISRLAGLIETDDGDPARAFAQLIRSADAIAGTLPDDAMWLRFLSLEAAEHAGDETGRAVAARAMREVMAPELRDTLGRWFSEELAGRPRAESSDPYRTLELVPQTGVPDDPRRPLMALALAASGSDRVRTGEFALELCARLRELGMINVLTIVLNWLAELEYRSGAWADSVEHADEAARMAQDSGQLSRRATALAQLARVAAVRGDDDSFARWEAEADEIGRGRGNHTVLATLAWARGLRELGRSDPRAALDHMLPVLAPSGLTASPVVGRLLVPDLADAAFLAGPDDRGGEVHRALAGFAGWADGTTLPWVRLHLAVGRALTGGGDVEPGLRAVLDSPDVADLPFLQARLHLTLGMHLRRDRSVREAREHLSAAERQFTRLGAGPWARRAGTTLRAAGGSSSGGPTGTAATLLAGLTPQEQHVTRLVVRGMSNKEIAGELFISPRTVGYHLYKIFPKLGVTSRSQLRRLAADAVG